MGLALLCAGLCGSWLIRSELWRSLLGPGLPRTPVLRWSALGFCLNQWVGYRSGDLLRAALARRHCGLAVGATSVVLLKAVDAIALALFAAIFAAAHLARAGQLAYLAAALAVALLAAPALARRYGAGKVLQALSSLRPLKLGLLVGGAFLALALEMLLFVGVGLLLGFPLGLGEGCLLMAAAGLSGLASFTPANLGPFEVSVGGALLALGHSGAVVWQLPLVAHLSRLAVSGALVLITLAARSGEGGRRWQLN